MSFTLSPTSLSTFSPTPSTPSRFPSPAPTPSPSSPHTRDGLLIPTDRPLEEVESKWLPRLGNLKVEREVRLQGFALYSLRSWFLSRTHFSHTIVTQTGKPTEQISAYLLVPSPTLSSQEGSFEIINAIRFLAAETQSTARRTEYGTLLVTTPSAFGQEVNPVPGGDLRVVKPYITVNTGLRRLGCGGRAVIGMESPIPALRRKFHELYRIPQPTHSTVPLSRNTSPSTSPTNGKSLSTSPLSDAHPQTSDITSDPFSFLVVELVKLIQSSLALWGMYGHVRGDLEIDGLFCDETKAGIFRWRRIMGMEHEESLKLEKETSGGCIDPKTLAALLSSVTSVHYELDALDVEKLPKDPFTSIRRFLNTWASYQTCIATTLEMPHYLTVPSIRSLAHHYLADRTRHPGDALKVHKLLFNGVAQATSSISANLKGGTSEDTPIRKREHHLRFRGDDEYDDEGVGLIIPEGEVGPVAPPDVITTDLEAYIKGILRSREKDWDIMGARRVAELWNGSVAEGLEDKPKRKGRMGSMNSSNGSMRDPHRGVLKKRTQSRDFAQYGIKEDDEGDNIKGAIKEISGRAGQAIKGGFGLVARRGTTYETSDSETGGPGPSSLKSAMMRKRQSTVPLLIEPDLEEVDEQLDRGQSASPSPSTSTRPLDRSWNTSSRPSFLTATSRPQSKRPSIVTQISGNESDIWSRASLAATGLSPTEERSDMDYSNRHSPVGGHSRTPSGQLTSNGRPAIARTPSDRALAWRNRGRATAMLRTASDGADVCIEETGMEWEIMNPHGTGKRSGENLGDKVLELTRRHSMEQVDFYKDLRRVEPEHLQIDVEMCAVVLELREREKQLSQRAKDVKLLEENVFKSLSQFVTSAKSRRSHVDQLSSTSSAIRTQIEALDMEDEHDHENSPRDRFHYYLSEETHRPELLDDLSRLKDMWEGIRHEQEEKRKIVEGDGIESGRLSDGGSKDKGGWFNWF
ncbi:hypothetical protein I302_100257 [Kwoniella bestiolae CBS 10118]|uniref:STB6-like N-terminal domain-containing protein n=1 Tax=Kwoniella bestiolae CBS 10118 TaxID=1296100 RepID=A0A1B9G4L4_9TREE|nr:hypothetical protein I302_03630 [Kwoniella bestiolae CBS 10118]OCF25953.1 hypothetical protein I302_03630 [Kwoniella bestiolae CBS 10118]